VTVQRYLIRRQGASAVKNLAAEMGGHYGMFPVCALWGRFFFQKVDGSREGQGDCEVVGIASRPSA